MAKEFFGRAADTSDTASEWARAIDLGLTWLRPPHRRPSSGQAWWLMVEQVLIDFFARYERVCLED